MKNLIISFVCFLFTLISVNAQDARLSQIWSLPSMMNPSLVGNTDDDFLAGIGYSNQRSKSSEVNHQYGFINGRLGRNYDSTGKAFGLGATFYQYQSGNFQNPSPINAKFFSVSAAYHIRLSKDNTHVLSLGTQFAFANASAYEKKAFYDKEINGGGFRWTDMNSLGSRTNSAGYLDWNLGVNYKFTSQNIGIEAGIGAYHFTHPKMALITPDTETRLRGRMVFHGKMDIAVSPFRALVLNNIFWTEGLYWRSTALDLYTLVANWSGAEFNKINKVDDKFSVNYGLYTRSFKTLMPYLSALPGSGVNLRISYEIPIASQLFQSYTAKRFELAVLYTPIKKDKNGKSKVSRRYINQKERAKRDSIQLKEIENKNSLDSMSQIASANNKLNSVSLDTDGDGVTDFIDKCPDQPGSIENQGCPNLPKNPLNLPSSSSDDYYSSMNNTNIIPKDTIQLFTFFDFNSSRLTQNSFALLNKVMDFLKRNNEYRIFIAGHSDFEGNTESNLRISASRASVVKSFLGSYGVSNGRMQTSFFGKTQLLVKYDMNLMWMNRRVEMLLVKVK